METNEIIHRYHFPDVGIYAMAWDGAGSIWIASSGDPKLYRYSTNEQNAELILSGFTSEVFVRCMSYYDGQCYLGIGSNAELIVVDTNAGTYESVLPNDLKENAFIYSQAICDGRICFLLKNALGIYSFDLDEFSFHKVTDYRSNKKNDNPYPLPWIDIEGDLLFIDIGGCVAGQYSFESLRAYYDDLTQCFYALDASCILHCYAGEEEEYYIGLSDVLEKSYIVPIEFIAYNDVLYFPGRRFAVWDRKTDRRNVFLVKDEPQASTVGTYGIYTGNYPDCTMYAYPFVLFHEDPHAVNLSSSRYLLADVDDQCRSVQMDISASDDYLVIGSGPIYGQFGGAVTVYSIRSGELLYSIKNVVDQQVIRTVQSSKAYEDAVWLGTMPYGENTNPPFLELPAHAVLWDITNQRIRKDIVIDDDIRKIISIAECDDVVYLTTEESYVYAYDINNSERICANTKDNILYLLYLTNGQLLGISTTCIYFGCENAGKQSIGRRFRAVNAFDPGPDYRLCLLF